MGLLDTRLTYAPFEYPYLFEAWKKQQAAHWLADEINMSGDVTDWKTRLTDGERQVIGSILKGFTQVEVLVNNYWSTKVSKWFKKPECQLFSSAAASFETIHEAAYSHLQETLGIEDYDAFLHEPTAKAKIDRLLNVPGKSRKEIAKSLAIFSAFTEGVNLFSSFAVLLHFSTRNLLKGVGQIITYSIRDESLHSQVGCYLFRTLMEEYPELWTDELKQELYEAARLTVELEDNFIDKSFESGPLPGLDPKDLKVYIRFRTNTKLGDLGLKSNWRNLDKEALNRMSWFDALSSGTEMQDFFSQRVTTYSKSGDWSNIYD